MYYNGGHWHDSLTADTCSLEFSKQKILEEYKGEYHFAHDLNSDGPRHLVQLGILISGENQNPEFPFLGGINITEMDKYISGYNKSVNHTQGNWYTQTKVGETDMSTEFKFRNDTLIGVQLEWNKNDGVFRQYPISYRVHDTLTSEFGKALHSFEILSKATKKKYGKPTNSDLADKDQIASFNTKGGRKRITQLWVLDEFTILLELEIYAQMKTTFRSRLKYSMIKTRKEY
jgi:hypothetical protein